MTDPGVRTAPLASPIHAILLAFPVALYPAALVSDIAYLQTAVVQWTNFSQWLIAGADLFAGLLLAWALIAFFFGPGRRMGARGARGRSLLYLIVVASMFVTGFVNALQHAKDGWHSVGTAGLVMSIVCTVLALVAAFIVHSRTVVTETRS
ncbi:hypothetical protein GRI62_03490 [Erythrobacter arachoides]|uniref:DUF2231 domain-containing protein n=1 Tax=Aurantiacibacter arachoides TaxID=1850444 RepID=A0A844ZZJ2_9SPHN|nr:DUF2231 domain-containing protein [Aurantiacibacter arachoides]MXO92670.1 hypothetical protein [Aurantiacibacter arachoides]GGD55340.1 membrane protein [Aurantiacibacter arachoides]